MATLDIANPDHDRQDVLVARAVVTFGTGNDIATTGTVTAINVPAGAIVIGGFVNVSDATSASVDIHVQSAALAVYAADIDGAATGVTALTPTGYKYTTADTIDVMVDTASAAADGQMELYVEYIIDGRSAFVQK
jgi:hypothetical protein